MKKILSVLLVCLVLPGCGNTPQKTPELPTRSVTTNQTDSRKKEEEEYRSLKGKEKENFLKKLEKNFSHLKTMKIDFLQEKHLEILSKPSIAHGVLYFKTPKSIRFEMQKPFQSILIVDNKKVARYEKKDKKWMKMKLASTEILAMVMNQISDWLKGNLRAQSRIYNIGVVEGKLSTVFLNPKIDKLKKVIESIELRLNEKQTRFDTVTIREPGGDHTILKLQKETHNLKLNKALFDTEKAEPQASQ
jgi:outer membrane lipoprotein carrier protein